MSYFKHQTYQNYQDTPLKYIKQFDTSINTDKPSYNILEVHTNLKNSNNMYTYPIFIVLYSSELNQIYLTSISLKNVRNGVLNLEEDFAQSVIYSAKNFSSVLIDSDLIIALYSEKTNQAMILLYNFDSQKMYTQKPNLNFDHGEIRSIKCLSLINLELNKITCVYMVLGIYDYEYEFTISKNLENLNEKLLTKFQKFYNYVPDLFYYENFLYNDKYFGYTATSQVSNNLFYQKKQNRITINKQSSGLIVYKKEDKAISDIYFGLFEEKIDTTFFIEKLVDVILDQNNRLFINYFLENEKGITSYMTDYFEILDSDYTIKVLDNKIDKNEYYLEFNKINREMNKKLFQEKDITELLTFNITKSSSTKTKQKDHCPDDENSHKSNPKSSTKIDIDNNSSNERNNDKKYGNLPVSMFWIVIVVIFFSSACLIKSLLLIRYYRVSSKKKKITKRFSTTEMSELEESSFAESSTEERKNHFERDKKNEAASFY